MSTQSIIEKLLFGRPTLYRIKRFLIAEVIWRLVLSGIFRMQPNPAPDLTPLFTGQCVLVAACGLGDVSTGPPISGAARVVAFDLSRQFAVACAQTRPDWQVYCGDLLSIPHRDNQFDVSVIYSTLHHVPTDAADVLAELGRITAGRIVLVEGVVPPSGLLRHALLLWYRLFDGGYRYYTRAELEDRFQRLGLRIESLQLCGPIKHMLLAVLDCQTRAVSATYDKQAQTT